MKTVALLCLVLVMQTMMIYAKPVEISEPDTKPEDILEEIVFHAKREDYPKELMDQRVPVIKNSSDIRHCPLEVFCLAEKSLHSANINASSFADEPWKLSQLLKNYNNMTQGNQCTVISGQTCHLKKMLNRLAHCASLKLKQLSGLKR